MPGPAPDDLWWSRARVAVRSTAPVTVDPSSSARRRRPISQVQDRTAIRERSNAGSGARAVRALDRCVSGLGTRRSSRTSDPYRMAHAHVALPRDCTLTKRTREVASMFSVIDSRRAPASNARARVAARAARIRSLSCSSIVFSARCVVVSALAPNSRSCPRNASMSVTQPPPSASITATSRSTRRGSCAERRSRASANASDSACQPDPIGQLHQQRDTGVRNERLSVHRQFYHSTRVVDSTCKVSSPGRDSEL